MDGGKSMFRWVGVAVFAAASVASAEAKWETVTTEPYVIKSRAVPGTEVKEIWAEGEIAAPVSAVEAALMDADGFSRFMPYVKESRTLGDRLPDGAQYVYTRLDFGSLVTSRDYVVKVYRLSSAGEDGSGEFKNRWVADASRIPQRANIIRLKLNEGSWHVVPRGANKSFAVYRFTVDPGGWIPSFAANAGNKQGVSDTFKAVEREAQRRAAEQRKASESARR